MPVWNSCTHRHICTHTLFLFLLCAFVIEYLQILRAFLPGCAHGHIFLVFVTANTQTLCWQKDAGQHYWGATAQVICQDNLWGDPWRKPGMLNVCSLLSVCLPIASYILDSHSQARVCKRQTCPVLSASINCFFWPTGAHYPAVATVVARLVHIKGTNRHTILTGWLLLISSPVSRLIRKSDWVWHCHDGFTFISVITVTLIIFVMCTMINNTWLSSVYNFVRSIKEKH